MATATQYEATDCYLIDRSGDPRYIWGPYTESKARYQAGARHAIIRGSALSGGATMTGGALRDAIQAGSIGIVSHDTVESL